MGLIKWRDDFDTGVPLFDKEHRKMVQMINDLFNAIKDKREVAFIKRIMEHLFSYTKYHFSSEETLMEKFNYPGFEEHKRQHQELTDEVLAFMKKFDQDVDTTTREVYQFLRRWLLEHIMESDKEYGSFFSKVGLPENM